jgi:Ca2+-binding EF-hand superfamily protein
MSTQSTVHYQEAFNKVDKTQSGFVSRADFVDVLHTAGMERAEAERVFAKIDTDASQAISYTEFLAATLPRRFWLSRSRVRDAFSRLAVDASGFITPDKLKIVMGDDWTPELAHQLFDDIGSVVGASHPGRVSVDELTEWFLAEFAAPAAGGASGSSGSGGSGGGASAAAGAGSAAGLGSSLSSGAGSQNALSAGAELSPGSGALSPAAAPTPASTPMPMPMPVPAPAPAPAIAATAALPAAPMSAAPPAAPPAAAAGARSTPPIERQRLLDDRGAEATLHLGLDIGLGEASAVASAAAAARAAAAGAPSVLVAGAAAGPSGAAAAVAAGTAAPAARAAAAGGGGGGGGFSSAAEVGAAK